MDNGITKKCYFAENPKKEMSMNPKVIKVQIQSNTT